jgi:hypothetical protein
LIRALSHTSTKDLLLTVLGGEAGAAEEVANLVTVTQHPHKVKEGTIKLMAF